MIFRADKLLAKLRRPKHPDASASIPGGPTTWITRASLKATDAEAT